ncbi:hypothetical protein JYU14_01835 [Simkania negevensis]|uniref:Ras-GEF domain-containing protein n=1 Tax=Simkania negevensis TaxID=83561 RepID=A0ABS3AQ19_9BACT|nr:hypothetical protein [Simkania negevensis]
MSFTNENYLTLCQSGNYDQISSQLKQNPGQCVEFCNYLVKKIDQQDAGNIDWDRLVLAISESIDPELSSKNAGQLKEIDRSLAQIIQSSHGSAFKAGKVSLEILGQLSSSADLHHLTESKLTIGARLKQAEISSPESLPLTPSSDGLSPLDRERNSESSSSLDSLQASPTSQSSPPLSPVEATTSDKQLPTPHNLASKLLLTLEQIGAPRGTFTEPELEAFVTRMQAVTNSTPERLAEAAENLPAMPQYDEDALKTALQKKDVGSRSYQNFNTAREALTQANDTLHGQLDALFTNSVIGTRLALKAGKVLANSTFAKQADRTQFIHEQIHDSMRAFVVKELWKYFQNDQLTYEQSEKIISKSLEKATNAMKKQMDSKTFDRFKKEINPATCTDVIRSPRDFLTEQEFQVFSKALEAAFREELTSVNTSAPEIAASICAQMYCKMLPTSSVSVYKEAKQKYAGLEALKDNEYEAMWTTADKFIALLLRQDDEKKYPLAKTRKLLCKFVQSLEKSEEKQIAAYQALVIEAMTKRQHLQPLKPFLPQPICDSLGI